MPKKVHEKLTARKVANISKPGYHIDGEGLYLQVTPGGAKTWVFRYMLNGRAREMGLGSVNRQSLSEARSGAEKQRGMLKQGVDPIETRDRVKAAQALGEARSRTFWECCESFLASPPEAWSNPKHAKQWRSTLETYAKDELGDKPVSAIATEDVLRVLEPIWRTKTETASRLRGRIEAVLDWARVRNYREGENPARWRGHLDKILPQRSKVQKVRHHPALPYVEIAAFMTPLRQQEGIAARALEFIILTACRTGEAIGARWAEVDFVKGIWTVPAERMKAKRSHRVALSDPAIAILRKMKAQALDGEYVFPGLKPNRHLSNMACLAVLERMQRTDLTVHGFRSTFRDWAAEQTSFPREVAEAALAHVIGDKTEAAYRRGDALEKRQRLMAAWAQHCEKPASATVIPMGRKRAK